MGQLRTLIIMMLIEGKCLSQKKFMFIWLQFLSQFKKFESNFWSLSLYAYYVMYRTIYPQIKWTGLDVVSDQVL